MQNSKMPLKERGDISKKMQSSVKTSRKKWSLQATSFHDTAGQEIKNDQESLVLRLRSQLADDGCVESQLQVAQTFLQMENSSLILGKENKQHAVHWLLQASQQGNPKATEMLQECLDKNIGISEHNYQQIKQCLNMDSQKKLAKGAVKQLFYRCCFGSNYISQQKLNILVEKIRHHEGIVIDETHLEVDESTCESLDKKYGSMKISETILLKSAELFANGHSPEILLNLRHSSNYIERLLGYLNRQLLQAFSVMVPQNLSIYSVCSLLILCIIAYVTIGGMYTICMLPSLVLFYSVVSIVGLHAEYDQFLVWSLLLKHFSDDLDVLKAQNQFKRRYYPFYICFITSFMCQLLVLISNFFMLMQPLYVFLSIFTLSYLLQKFYFFTYTCTFVYMGHLYCKYWDITGNAIEAIPYEELYITSDISCQVTLSSVLQAAWILCVITIAYRYGFHHACLNLISNVCMHMAFYSFVRYYSDWSLLICFSILIGPLLIKSTVLVVVPLVAATSLFVYIFSNDWYYTVIINIIVILAGTMVLWFRPTSSTIVRYLVGFIGVAVGYYYLTNTIIKVPVSDLSWNSYESLCIPQEGASSLELSYRCQALTGSIVEWKGTIKNIDYSVTNSAEDLISLFPYTFQIGLRCLFSQKRDFCSTLPKSFDRSACEALAVHKPTCSLESWNKYTFHLVVSIGTTFWSANSPQVLLQLNPSFESIVLQLLPNDQLKFVGMLQNNLGSNLPEINIISLNCISCHNTIKEFKCSADIPNRLKYADIFNFMFEPLLTMKS